MPGAPLPVDDAIPPLLGHLERVGAVVLRAPTGAGKTTRVPPAVLDASPSGRVVVLEPRRVAARAAARRIAEERGVPLGAEVGYQVRFDRKASRSTRLLVVTEGVLLRRLQEDPFLEDVGTVVFDEFHERSLDADLALALVQRLRTSVREDLRAVVMSATLDPGPVAGFLGQCPTVTSEGRAHPVEIEHAPPRSDARLEETVRSAVLDVVARTEGDVLVFLPGVGEIRRAARALEGIGSHLDLKVFELHGELPPERQDAALAPADRRKVILATNVAETSLTIPGVRVVIDSGLERLPRVDPALALPRLELVRISRASAEQRAGRAGREAPGLCVRLWGRAEDARLPARRPPEIERADLAPAALQLHAWGEPDLRVFPFFEPPPEAALEAAERLLERLGALQGARLTDVGRAMARMPLHPRLARLLAEAGRLGHGRRLALAAALLSDRPPFERPQGDASDRAPAVSDVLAALEAVEEFEATGRLDTAGGRLRRGPTRQVLRARDQIARYVEDGRRGRDADEAVLRALLVAYPDRLARRRRAGSDRAVMVGGRGVRLAPQSRVREPELFVGVDVDAGRRGERAEAWVRAASKVERSWLPPERLETVEIVDFDARTESVVGVRQTRFEDLVLDEVRVQTPRGPEVERVLARAAAADLDAALPLDDPSVASLCTRLACLRSWRPELELPAFDDEALRALLPTLVRGLRSFAELRKAPLLDTLRGLLTWQQQQTLDAEAPERLPVPNGGRIRLRYELGRPPVLAARIQQVFGLTETPTVAGGRVKVLMHLLAPNGRPQQITDDMPSFWKNTYASVRAELRRRYPKHAWPEDPSSGA